MWEKIKRYWVRYLTIFVTVLIPLFAWVSGLLPAFVSAEDLQVYERKFQDLDIKQTDLAIEFKRSEREDTEEDRLRVEREIFKIQRENDEVPPFYTEQKLRYEQKIDRLNQEIEDLRQYRLDRQKGGGSIQ